MTASEDALDAWEQRLREAEAELRAREDEALGDDAPPEVLLALAAERDKVALDRDSIASRYDEIARGRDRSALARDLAGSDRDRAARAQDDDRDPAYLDRFEAGEDRDLAAGDRGESFDDRRRAQQTRGRAAADRVRAAEDRDAAAEKAVDAARDIAGLRTALESRLVIGQAQGLLMAFHHLKPDAAFQVLVRLSQEHNVEIQDVAARFVASQAGRRGAEPSDSG